MANEIFENIWKIMKENKFHLINEINNDLFCNICNKLMVKACNSPCHCKYCSDCIENYLDGIDNFCPGKDKFCQMKMINFEKDIVINHNVNKMIAEIVVKCPNGNCEYIDQLSLIENHMKTCDKNPSSCKNNEMKDHFYTEISCHTKLLIDIIDNLRIEIESMKNDIVEIKLENKNLKNELDEIKIESKFNRMKNEEFENRIKNNLSEIEELNEEMIVIKNENSSMMDKLEKIEKSRINELIERIQSKSEQQIREIEEIKEKSEQTENKDIEMRRLIEEMFHINADLMKKSSNDEEKINNLRMKMIEMEINIGIISFVEILWKIDNFSKQQRETCIYSDPFYSHKNGYKMCLSLWIRGDCVYGEVCFHMIRGEFDDNLLWPFKHGVTIDIFNQKNGGVFTSKTIKYADFPNDQAWNKPTTERNNYVGVKHP